MIVDTEKVLREADGSVELLVVRPHADGKVFAPGVRVESRTVKASEEHEEDKRKEVELVDSVDELQCRILKYLM